MSVVVNTLLICEIFVAFMTSNGYFIFFSLMVILKLMPLPGPYLLLGFIEIELHKTSDLGEIRVGDEGNGRGELGKMEGSHV